MAVGDDEANVRAERARAIGLFRYQLIGEAADPSHSTEERGTMMRELASREHIDPFGRRVRISRHHVSDDSALYFSGVGTATRGHLLGDQLAAPHSVTIRILRIQLALLKH